MRLKVYYNSNGLLKDAIVNIIGEPTDEKCTGAISDILKLKSAETVEVIGWELA